MHSHIPLRFFMMRLRRTLHRQAIWVTVTLFAEPRFEINACPSNQGDSSRSHPNPVRTGQSSFLRQQNRSGKSC